MNLPYVYGYSGEHSVSFKVGDVWKHTWNDWGLIPSSRQMEPVHGELWSQSVAIPGVNGQGDLLRKYPFYAVNSYSQLRNALKNDHRDKILSDSDYDLFQPMSGNLSFVIADQEVSFEHKRREILDFLHGKTATIRFEDHPDQTYEAMVSVESFSNGNSFSGVSFAYSVISES